MRNNQAYMEHQFRQPKAWAEGMLTWFGAHLSKKAVDVLSISKVQQDLFRWDSKNIPAQATSVSFFKKDFVATNAGMPGDGFTPPTSEHMGIIGIALYEGQATDVKDTDWQYGINSGAFKNATLRMIVNGDTKLSGIPLTRSMDGLTTDELGYIPLSTWLSWEGNTNIEVIIDFPVPPQLLEANIRVELQGFGFGA